MQQPYTMLLHSAPTHPLGRWTLLAEQPWQVAVIYGSTVHVHTATSNTTLSGDPWAIMAQLCAPYRQQTHPEHPCPGGVLGYLGYDLGRLKVRLPAQPDLVGLPDAVFGWYRQVIAWRSDATSALLGCAEHAPTSTVAPALPLAPSAPALSATLERSAYLACVRQIKAYIEAGDIYQANMTMQMQACASDVPWSVYQRLQARTAAPFGAWIALPEATVLSASPERFLWCSASGYVETRPIKGTRPRGQTPAADAAQANDLYTSPKERAENLMITDLLRNDIGQVCQIGSVHVPALWQVETLPTVHHLVSTISGQLDPRYSAWDLLRACWPGGSITGAPKRRAMEIIAALEPVRRGIYCGSIGYWGFDGSMDTSIVIRTLVEHAGRYTWGIGGGIVADSDPEAEYAEALLKGAALEAALHTESAQPALRLSSTENRL